MGFYRSIRRKLDKAGTLSGSEWGALFQAWGLLLFVDWGLRLIPFRQVQGLLSMKRSGARSWQAGDVWARIERVHWLVMAAARHHLYPMRCLRQALVLQWLLARRGIDADLRFGGQKEAGSFRAHAWLEYEGRPIGESTEDLDQFIVLAKKDAALTQRLHRC